MTKQVNKMWITGATCGWVGGGGAPSNAHTALNNMKFNAATLKTKKDSRSKVGECDSEIIIEAKR